jgi:hypothetical protein
MCEGSKWRGEGKWRWLGWGYMVDRLHISIWSGAVGRGTDDGGNVNNVQYKLNQNCNYESPPRGRGQDGGLFDIHIDQQQLTTLKKDQRTPKVTYWGPITSKKQSPLQIPKQRSNHGRNGKNDLQLNTHDPPPLKLPHSSRLHYLAFPWW